MRTSYDRENDILLLEVSKRKIDYAEEMEPIIVHFSKDHKPVLLEILDASDFMSSLIKNSIATKEEKMVPLTV